jgi:hypothetical protein
MSPEQAQQISPEQAQQGTKSGRFKEVLKESGRTILEDTISGILVAQINSAITGTTTTAPGATTLAPTDPRSCKTECSPAERCFEGKCVARPTCDNQDHAACGKYSYCSKKGYCRPKKEEGEYCSGVVEKCLPNYVCKTALGGIYSKCWKDETVKFPTKLLCQDSDKCLQLDCNMADNCQYMETSDEVEKCSIQWGSWAATKCPLTCGFCEEK